jgi:hypothetical protein
MFLTLVLVYGQATSRSPWLGYELKVSVCILTPCAARLPLMMRPPFAPPASHACQMLFMICYGLVLFTQLVVGLAGTVTHSSGFYLTVTVLYAVAMFFSLAIAAWLLADGGLTWWIGLGMACSIFTYLAAALMHGQLVRVTMVMLQYVSFLPVYINVFAIYSICNTHDVSWCVTCYLRLR